MSDELVFELTLAPASSVVKGLDATKLACELTNIQLEYEVIQSKKLSDEVNSNLLPKNNFRFEAMMESPRLMLSFDGYFLT